MNDGNVDEPGHDPPGSPLDPGAPEGRLVAGEVDVDLDAHDAARMRDPDVGVLAGGSGRMLGDERALGSGPRWR